MIGYVIPSFRYLDVGCMPSYIYTRASSFFLICVGSSLPCFTLAQSTVHLDPTMVPASAQKTVLITGCSLGGIGDALAQSFYYKGLRVFATARDLSKIQHLKEMGMTVLALDAVDTLSIKGAVESVQESTAGTLDILVNNAGIGEILQPLLTGSIQRC